MGSSFSIIDYFDAKAIRRPATPNSYSPLLLMMLAACGGGGGGNPGKPRVKTSDDGSYVSSSMWENTTEVESTSHEANYEAVEQFLETFRREVESVVGKSPGKAKLNDFYLAPDGKSVTFKMGFVNPKLSLLSFNLKIELVGDDAEFFRMVRLDGLGTKIEFVNAPNYERPRDKDANNYYSFQLKYTLAFDEIGEPEIDYTHYAVRVNDVVGHNDPVNEDVIRAFNVAENISFIGNNLISLQNISRIQGITLDGLKIADDGSSATMTMTDKATGIISTITIRLTGQDADKIKIGLLGDVDDFFGLEFKISPDYENRTDHDKNNVYEFSLTYTGLKSPEVTHFRITITDVDESGSSQSQSSQSTEIFHPDPDYIMPEIEDSPPPADII